MAFEPPERLVGALDEQQRRRAADGESGGQSAAEWLAALRDLVPAAVARRGLQVERVHAPGGRSSVVLLVRCADGTPAVLKLAPPAERPDLERAALAHWGGHSAVRLLDPGAGILGGAGAGGTDGDGGDGGDGRPAGPGDRTAHGAGAGGAGAGAGNGTGTGDDGALLLERLRPDVSVRSLPQDRSMLEAAETLRRLWVPLGPDGPTGFETVAARTSRAARAAQRTAETYADPEVTALLGAALTAHRTLLETAQGETVLLHGAFRQSKVLAGERLPWLAVGPQPLVGEPAFDLARLVRDRVEDLVATESGPATARRRVKRLAGSLEVEQDRLGGWTLFRAVVSGVQALGAGRRRDAELLLEFASWL